MSRFSSVKFQIKLRQVVWIAFAWFLLGALDALLLHMATDNAYIYRTEVYRFLPVFLAYSFGFALSGFFVGILLIFLLKDKFRNKSFLFFSIINSSVKIKRQFCQILIYV